MLAEIFYAFVCFTIVSAVDPPPAPPVESHTWDVAITLKDEIKLLTKDGTLVASLTDKFNDIKAVTYNYEKNVFIVGDREKDNDTIYIMDADTLEVTPIVEDLSDDIQGIAVDATSELVYWTDAISKAINFHPLRANLSLEDPQQTLFTFQDQKPQDLAIDSCKRMIYWTNANMQTPTIEKSTVMGTDKKVLVVDAMTPTGVAIDHLEQRLYWTDMMSGIYFQIESVDLDGNDRQLLFKGTHQKPFGLAVDKDFVYWIETNDNALWRQRKYSTEAPEHIFKFSSTPNGIAARYMGFPDVPNCEKLAMLIRQRHHQAQKENEKQREYIASENKTCPVCVHGVADATCSCVCEQGYAGEQCELDVCYNYCQNGDCRVDGEGKPVCNCQQGYTGERCGQSLCGNLCLNGGVCHVRDPSDLVCTCPKGFTGDRCETVVPVSTYDVCKSLCANSTESIVVHADKSFLCRCSDLSYMGLETSNKSSLQSVFNEFSDTPHVIVFILGFSNVLTLALSVALAVYVCRIKRRRPRIKKRVVVNKNITPLTYRPQVEQCEITIENCCNMNVCETPCFEPRNFTPSKKDEKKVLLANMENNEEY